MNFLGLMIHYKEGYSSFAKITNEQYRYISTNKLFSLENRYDDCIYQLAICIVDGKSDNLVIIII